MSLTSDPGGVDYSVCHGCDAQVTECRYDCRFDVYRTVRHVSDWTRCAVSKEELIKMYPVGEVLPNDADIYCEPTSITAEFADSPWMPGLGPVPPVSEEEFTAQYLGSFPAEPEEEEHPCERCNSGSGPWCAGCGGRPTC